MQYFVYVAIERKEAILDPQGKAVEHALGTLGFTGVSSARIGKLVRLSLEATSEAEARRLAEDASAKLLANPIMETFSVITVTTEPSITAAHATA